MRRYWHEQTSLQKYDGYIILERPGLEPHAVNERIHTPRGGSMNVGDVDVLKQTISGQHHPTDQLRF